MFTGSGTQLTCCRAPTTPVSGPGSTWYVAAIEQEQLRVGSEHRDVTFEEADSRVDDAVDLAYEDEYDHRPSIEPCKDQGRGAQQVWVGSQPWRP